MQKEIKVLIWTLMIVFIASSVCGIDFVDAHGFSLSGGDSGGDQPEGAEIIALFNGTLNNITKHASTTATMCVLYDGNFTGLFNDTFVNNNCHPNYPLLKNAIYYVGVYNGGIGFTRKYTDGMPFPTQGTNIVWNAGFYLVTRNTGYMFDILSVTIDNATGYIPANPVWVVPTPYPGSRNNTNVTLNVSLTLPDPNIRFYIWFGKNGTQFNDSSLVLANSVLGEWDTNITSDEGTYFYLAGAYNTSNSNWLQNTSVRNVTFDFSRPVITPEANLGTNNTFVWNGSYLSTYINFSDNLEIYSINVSWLNGTIIKDQANIGQNNFSVNISQYISSDATQGIFAKVCDAHTSTEISELKVKKDKSGLKYVMNEWMWIFDDEWISIYPEDYAKYDEAETEKKIERYTFKFNHKNKPNKNGEAFIVESSSFIDIPKLQLYPGHLVVPGIPGGYWVDFDNPEVTGYNAERITDNKIRIVIYGLTKQSIEFNSIGELNCINQTFWVNNLNVWENFSLSSIAEIATTIQLNLTINKNMVSKINATLFYNNTVYYSGTETNFSEAPITPIVDDIRNISFYWTYFINGMELNTTMHNQTVADMFLSNCSNPLEGTRTSLNFSLRDSVTGLSKTGNFSVSFQLWDIQKTRYKNFSFWGYVPNQSICLYPDQNLYVDGIVSFKAPSYKQGFYYINNLLLTAETQQIILFLQNETLASNIYIYVKTVDGDPVVGAYVKVMEFDPTTNSYNTQYILETDNNGEVLAPLIPYDKLYKFIVQYNNQVYLETNPTQIKASTIILKINLDVPYFSDFEASRNINYILNYTNTTQLFRFTFNDASNLVDTGCLEVERKDGYGDEVICKNCSTSTAATLYCFAENNISGSYTATAYILDGNNVLYYLDSLEINFFNNNFLNFGPLGVFLALLTVGLCFAVGSYQPSVGIIMGLLSLSLISIFGLFSVSWPVLMVLWIIGGIIIYKQGM